MTTRTSKSRSTKVPGLQIDGSTRIVYIHGIGEQLPPAKLKEEWDRALFGRPMRKTTCVAYWSDIQYPGCDTREAPAVSTKNVVRLPDELFAAFADTARHVTGPEKKYIERMTRALTARTAVVNRAPVP